MKNFRQQWRECDGAEKVFVLALVGFLSVLAGLCLQLAINWVS